MEVDDDRNVRLTLEPEAEGEPGLDRSLLPGEARTLAAVLIHFADEAVR